MKSLAYRLLRRHLDQERRNRIKRHLFAARAKLGPWLEKWHGSFDAEDLQGELKERIGLDFEILMVHSSMNKMAPMYQGGAGEVLAALRALCGESRTLVMPAFYFGGRSNDVLAAYRARPLFRARRQPSEAGLLTELFRRCKGVERSLHPTHSVCALGPLASYLTRDHHLQSTTFGKGTPFGRMNEHRTAILGIGTRFFRCLTHVHCAEDLLGDAFPLDRRFETVEVTLEDFDGSKLVHTLRYGRGGRERRIERLRRWMPPAELLEWRFHGVPMFHTTASRVTQALMDAAAREETIYGG